MNRLSVLFISVWAVSLPAFSSPGHDHGSEGASSAVTGGPHRLPDGSVFLPKPAQRQIGVRTTVTAVAALPRGVELQGRVVMDPNAGGRVQAVLAGRLQPGPKGLPTIGQAVRAGEVLAYVVPSSGQIERANQSAQLAELRASRALAEKRLARYRELADTVPRKEIEAAESEVASLGERITAVGGGLTNRDVLTAPVSGVIASANAVSGQVVEARELVFEVVDPKRLRVEAMAYDLALARNVGGAYLAVGTERVPLVFLGAARVLREQALPLVFRAEGGALAALAVGQPVRVFVATRATVEGVAVPAASLVKNPANETIVWVKTAAEHFVPRPVQVEPLDGTRVAVVVGLRADERVVTAGATLVNQIR